MSSIVALSDALITAHLQSIADAVDAHAILGGEVRFYDGVRPSKNGTATNLQGTIVFDKPCGAVSGATLTFTVPCTGVRVSDQTITWARVVDGGGAFVMDADVSVTAGNGAFKLSNVDGVIGGTLELTSGVLGA